VDAQWVRGRVPAVGAVTTITAVADATGVTTGTTGADSVTTTELRSVAAVAGATPVPTCVATVTAIETIATVTDEQASVATVAWAIARATGGIEGEPVADEQSGVGIACGASAKQDVDTAGGLGANALKEFWHASGFSGSGDRD